MAKEKQKTYDQIVNSKTTKTTSTTIQKNKGWMFNVLPILVLIAGLAAAAIQLVSLESEVLFKGQEMSLWVPGETYYQHFSMYPGGWLSWVGCYLTQFFYHPTTGVLLLTLAWAVIMTLQAGLYRLRGWKVLLAGLVPMMLLTAFTQTGYWIYYQKLPGHLWVPTLGVLFSLVAACIYKALSQNVFVIKTKVNGEEVETRGSRIAANVRYFMSLIWMAVFGWYGYQLMGAWSFLGLALMASLSVNGLCGKSLIPNIIRIIEALAIAFIVPRIAYAQVYEQTLIDEIYHAAMPCFKYGKADMVIYRCAYYLLFASFLPMVLAYAWPEKWSQRKPVRWLVGLAVVATFAYGFHTLTDRWNRDKNYHAEIEMSNAISRLDWEGVLRTMRATSTDTIAPTRAMVMMKNLALFRLGRFGNEFLQYPEGARQQNIDEYYKYGDKMYDIPAELDTIADAETRELKKMEYKWSIRLSQIAGKLAYYNYGKLNYCYRWCMEDAVEFGWKVDELKMMAMCCMLKGEDVVAHKYFDILKRTRYHKEWAEHYEALIGKPEEMRKQPELLPICFLKEYGNRLDGDNTLIELYLLKTFANGNGADPVYQEMTLNSALLMKDIDLFWPRFMQYATMHNKEKDFHMPRYYQEAAYLYGHLENKVDISKMPFDQSVKDSYERFMQFNMLPNIGGLSDEQKAKEFKPQFGDTFYYFYFLVRNQKTN